MTASSDHACPEEARFIPSPCPQGGNIRRENNVPNTQLFEIPAFAGFRLLAFMANDG